MNTITHYLYTIQPTRPEMLSEGFTPEEGAAMQEHFGYLQSLMAEEKLVLAGRTLTADASSFGMAVIRAESEEEARCIMEDDPAVKSGVARGTLYPYQIALMP